MDVGQIISKYTTPPLSYRFGVVFFVAGLIPNPLDIKFQKVSGLTSTISTTTVEEGGQNLYSHRLPKKVQYDNLVLERGMVIGSPLNIEFNVAMSLLKFAPSNVLVSLLDESGLPLAAWLFFKAYPVKWSVSDLNAGENSVMVDTMELAYTRFQSLRV
ncbi:MAG: phage tail protein [Bacteroidia bacterium]|nr:phage tail protein [Bacteroidia bacterium]